MNKYVKEGLCLVLATGLIASSFAGCAKVNYVTEGAIKAMHQIKDGSWKKQAEGEKAGSSEDTSVLEKSFEAGKYGGVEFKSLEDVANYYKEAYDYTKTLTAEYVNDKGQTETFYKLLGDEKINVGKVMIDGKDVRNVTIESLRSQMGIMTQDSFLFTGTVKENIRYGKLDATDEEVIAAAKAVNAHDFIMQLKDGYDTELSERGGGLSIGQKQLLAFARTMISMPKILILDEATSSIDTQTELLVQKGIDALLKGRTSFVVAHRLSTIRKANRIFVVDNAHIIEEGSHDELLAKKGAYYRLYMAQFSHALGVSQDIDNAAGM